MVKIWDELFWSLYYSIARHVLPHCHKYHMCTPNDIAYFTTVSATTVWSLIVLLHGDKKLKAKVFFQFISFLKRKLKFIASFKKTEPICKITFLGLNGIKLNFVWLTSVEDKLVPITRDVHGIKTSYSLMNNRTITTIHSTGYWVELPNRVIWL